MRYIIDIYLSQGKVPFICVNFPVSIDKETTDTASEQSVVVWLRCCYNRCKMVVHGGGLWSQGYMWNGTLTKVLIVKLSKHLTKSFNKKISKNGTPLFITIKFACISCSNCLIIHLYSELCLWCICW